MVSVPMEPTKENLDDIFKTQKTALRLMLLDYRVKYLFRSILRTEIFVPSIRNTFVLVLIM